MAMLKNQLVTNNEKKETGNLPSNPWMEQQM